MGVSPVDRVGQSIEQGDVVYYASGGEFRAGLVGRVEARRFPTAYLVGLDGAQRRQAVRRTMDLLKHPDQDDARHEYGIIPLA